MKLDICEKIIRHSEICSDIKYCCKWMESMVEQHYIDIELLSVNLYIDDSRNYGRYYMYHERRNDIIPLSNRVVIQYCPFCGEKIEKGERKSSPI